MKKPLFIYVLLILIVVAGGYAYYKYFQKQKMTQYKLSFEDGRKLLHNGDPKSSLLFEEALKNASTKNEEASAKINLGLSYMLLQREPLKGISLLKEVSLDSTLPKFYRAGAANYTITYSLGKKDIEFAKKYIFTGDIWQSFLTAEGNSELERVELAERKGYEWSAELFSTFIAEYRVAWWYAKQIKYENVASNAVISDYANIIKERIARGDAALASALLAGKTPISQIGLAYNLKGIALEGLSKIDRTKAKDVRAAYEQAINILDTDPGDFQARGTVLYVRYNFAAFLARESKTDKAEIAAILEPIYKITNETFFYGFLREERNIAVFGVDPIRKDILNLAKIDSKFKKLLIDLGWQGADFK